MNEQAGNAAGSPVTSEESQAQWPLPQYQPPQPGEPQPDSPTPEAPPIQPTPQAPSVAGYQPSPSGAPIGKIRPTGVAMILCVVTLGIYSLVWFYQVHEEMKRHKGTGLGGGLALVLAIFVGIAMPYLTSSEVGELYEQSGQTKPVSGLTGLWYFPGMLLLVGPIVWFVKTNGALNAYWRAQGAR